MGARRSPALRRNDRFKTLDVRRAEAVTVPHRPTRTFVLAPGGWYVDRAEGAAPGVRFRVLAVGVDVLSVADAWGNERTVNKLRFEADMVLERTSDEQEKTTAEAVDMLAVQGAVAEGRDVPEELRPEVARRPIPSLRYRRVEPEPPRLTYRRVYPETEATDETEATNLPDVWDAGHDVRGLPDAARVPSAARGDLRRATARCDVCGESVRADNVMQRRRRGREQNVCVTCL